MRSPQTPQRVNGRLRVAAILEAAATVIAEKGYEVATMSEIAARSGTKIGSLYRFFPNKQSLADTIIISARENVDAVFDEFDARVRILSIPAMTKELMALLAQLFTRPAFMKLLEAGQNWSVKREEFRIALHQRTLKTLRIHTPKLSKKSAAEIADVILLNVKGVATHLEFFNPPSKVPEEVLKMTRLYLQNRLAGPRN